ncbi:MAG: hypothetical protein Q9170_005997 [Blastenia crenularia]
MFFGSLQEAFSLVESLSTQWSPAWHAACAQKMFHLTWSPLTSIPRLLPLRKLMAIIMVLADEQVKADSTLESEYLADAGIIYSGRLAPINDITSSAALFTVQSKPSLLKENNNLTAMVQSGKLYFEDQDETLQSLGSTEAKVKVVVVGIDQAHASDAAGLGYQSVSTRKIGGIVMQIGSDVSHLSVVDKVVGFCSNSFSTYQITPGTLLFLVGNDSLHVSSYIKPSKFNLTSQAMVSLPIAFSTAIYGLEELAHIEGGETILVFDNTGAAGLAAIQICRKVNVNFILLTGRKDVEEHLIGSGFKERRGADIVFSASTIDGSLLQCCVLNLASFARITFVGERNTHLSDLNQLSNSKQLSMFVFDMLDICQRKPRIVARLLERWVQVFKDGAISNAMPIHVSSLSEADKVVSDFSSDIAFMARSGADRPAAENLVCAIETRGAEVTVLRGDVAQSSDVENAIRTITQQRQLRGVVNAAMVLNDGLFQSMDISSWRQTVEPKVKGSYNLHEVVKDLNLDFFVLLSSTSGILGTPSQSNCAGYVADNPKIEESLLRKGIYGIYEDELLAGLEAAMKPQQDNRVPNDRHIILGLEPSKLARSVAQPESTDAFWLSNPHFSTNVAMMDRMTRHILGAPFSSIGNIIADIRASKSITCDEAIATITPHICQWLARLLSLGEEEVVPDNARSVASYGLDSMIGTEFRNWLFRGFGEDVPYQRLLAGDLTVGGLAAELYDGALGDKRGGEVEGRG